MFRFQNKYSSKEYRSNIATNIRNYSIHNS